MSFLRFPLDIFSKGIQMKMPWKGREGHVFFVLLPTTTFLLTRWNSKRIKEILIQRQKVISHANLMIREYVLIWTTLILIGPVTFRLHWIWWFIRFRCQKMLFHLHFTEETVQLRLMVGKMLLWCQSFFFSFSKLFPQERDRAEISSFSSNYEKP